MNNTFMENHHTKITLVFIVAIMIIIFVEIYAGEQNVSEKVGSFFLLFLTASVLGMNLKYCKT